MKKTLIYFLLAITIFSSCKKNDDTVFDQSPDERINEAMAAYQSALVSAPYGWKAVILPAGLAGGAVGFYFKFNESNRVEMFSDFDSTSAVTAMEASYRLKALQQPSLIFDTYSYVHVLADPDASNNGGDYGNGLYSDFEFAINSLSGDTMYLTGRFHGSKAVLIKATQQEAEQYYNQQLSNRLFNNINKYITYFKRLVAGGREYEVGVNLAARTITFTWVDENGDIQTFTTGFYYTPDGIGLYPAFTDGTNTIAGFDNITWDNVNTVMSFTINGASSAIVGSGTPIKVDLDAPRRWWQYVVDQGAYWVSLNGFHVNGIDDAFGITQTPNYYFMLFWPKYGTSGGVTYDLLAPVKLLSGTPTLEYGLAYRPPNFTADGRVKFTFYGTLGTVPSADSTAAANSRIQMAETNGYYLVQTGATSYDMVSAKDGKAWVSWVW